MADISILFHEGRRVDSEYPDTVSKTAAKLLAEQLGGYLDEG